MARPRKKKTEGLPPRVYLAKGRYFIRQPDGSETKLAPSTASKAEVWRAFLKVPQAKMSTGIYTLRALTMEYMRSEKFRGLAYGTQRDATRALNSVLAFPTADGREFGDCRAEDVTVGVMRLFMDKRGEGSKHRANLELAYTSAMYSWAFEREMVSRNPCKGIKRFKVEARERYVEDGEYQERHALAGELGRPDVQVMMELAYLCRLRENEILKIMDSPAFISPSAGLLAKRGKGSKTQWIAWSPRLETAIASARSIERRIPTPMLICSPHSRQPLSLDAFQSAWQTIKQEARKRGHAVDWHFHDLKAKGVSDFEGDKHIASGHKTHRMTEVYDRRKATVPSTR
ncbi:MAG TPA: hypothetical protein VHE37_08760 [Nevskiaceae bacterium]|nr:hypothetical protein [Nevskiaceae bacterium]